MKRTFLKRVSLLNAIALIAVLVASGLALLLFLLERYVIASRVPEMEPQLLSDLDEEDRDEENRKDEK